MAAGHRDAGPADARRLRRARARPGAALEAGLREAAADAGREVAIARVGSLLTVFFRSGVPRNWAEAAHVGPRRVRPLLRRDAGRRASCSRRRSSRPGSSRRAHGEAEVAETLAAARTGVRRMTRRTAADAVAGTPPRPARTPASCAPPAACPWTRRRSGSCARPAARSPSTARIRERATLLEITRDPALCAEVTLQPVRRLGVDAAILFADITTPFAGLGVDFDIVEGRGPVIERPVRTLADVEALRPFEPEAAVAPLLEAIRLDPRASRPVPLIGFAGAPFTLACYLVEGGPSRDFVHTKRADARGARDLGRAARPPRRRDDRVPARAGRRRRARPSRCSTPGSAVSRPLDYERRLWPWMRRLFDGIARARRADDPLRRRARAGSCDLQASAGGDVIGLDWRIALSEGRRLVGDRAVQGNLDPVLLLGPWDGRRGGRALDPRPERPATRPRLQPRARRPARAPTRTTSRASSTSSTTMERPDDPDAVLLMAYGSPRPARPGGGLLHRHPARQPAAAAPPRGAARTATGRSAAGRPCRGSSRSSGRRWRPSWRRAGCRCRVYAGMRHIAPRIGDIVKGMAADGVTRFVAIALAPQASSNAAGYRRAVDTALADLATDAPTVEYVDSWHDQPRFIEALAQTTREALARFEDPTGVRVMFTAHSLPARVLADGDPYPARARGDGAPVADALGPRRLRVRVPERGAHRRAVAGPGHPRRDPPPRRRGRAGPGRSGRSASSRITWRSSTTSTSRRRAWPARPASAWSARAR